MFLHGRLELHDIRDGEAFCIRIAARQGLSGDEFEDLVSFLVGELWRLSRAYDPQRGARFASFATPTLQRRVTDWKRQRYGRTRYSYGGGRVRERPRMDVVSLDVEPHPLGESLATREGDPEDSWDPTLAGILGGADRTRASDLAELGLGPAR